MTQTIIVAVMITLAIILTVRRLLRSLRGKGDCGCDCDHCPYSGGECHCDGKKPSR